MLKHLNKIPKQYFEVQLTKKMRQGPTYQQHRGTQKNVDVYRRKTKHPTEGRCPLLKILHRLTSTANRRFHQSLTNTLKAIKHNK